MPMLWAVIALVIGLVSFVLALIGHEIASPTYLILLGIFVVLFFKATSPW